MRAISELRSIPFYEIIGAPLLAIVEGQARAAQATVEFIEGVGFVKDDTNDKDTIGELRMVSFSYQKPGVDGTPQTHRLELPLLSLVQIPAIEVSEAELEFNVKVADVFQSSNSSSVYNANVDVGHWLHPNRTEYRASLGSMRSNSSSSQTLDVQMNVKLKLERSDVTVGMTQLLQTMDQAINSSEVN